LNSQKAVFFDRDGTIIEEKKYLFCIDDVVVFADVLQALRLLKDNGYLLIMVSNQSGVARGYFDINDVHKVNNYINNLLIKEGVEFDGIYFCPHHPQGIISDLSYECKCRKPHIKMALDAASDFNIALNESYMVGDKLSDINFGHNFGAKGVVHVATGHEMSKNVNAYFSENLLNAAEWILQENTRRKK
jgi:D-glycero-D-manno-heptose 1,7-bisphosphate phosphatase